MLYLQLVADLEFIRIRQQIHDYTAGSEIRSGSIDRTFSAGGDTGPTEGPAFKRARMTPPPTEGLLDRMVSAPAR